MRVGWCGRSWGNVMIKLLSTLVVTCILAGCATQLCQLPPDAPTLFQLSRGSAFYGSVEYIRLEENGWVRLDTSDKKHRYRVCLTADDWKEIRRIFDSNQAKFWNEKYRDDRVPSDGHADIAVAYPTLRVATSRYVGVASGSAVDESYDAIRTVVAARLKSTKGIEID